MADTSKYNTTDLEPQATFERHVFHRDQFAHYLRWTHILREARTGERICDFGCGRGNLLEVLYRNKFAPSLYVGLDIRAQTIKKAQEKYSNIEKFRVAFIADDLIHPTTDLETLQCDRICSFEVAEHVGRQNVDAFLYNFALCGKPDGTSTWYLSTPNHDPKVGAAGNHTYSSGRIDPETGEEVGVEVHELDHEDLQDKIIAAGFNIDRKFGTFASQRDYKPFLEQPGNEWLEQTYEALKEYYDSNLVANIMAPIVPAEMARNCLWVLSRPPAT